ncbi:MAG: DNA mismatch repair protein MutS [Pseudomonadota bacterium]
MMVQFLEIKEQHKDALLFYRMGDFYELFFDDAQAAAAALDIALTKRGKHLGEDIAMCGVPHHAAEGYLLTLIRKGFRVAICEQMERPEEAKKRGHKAVVKRDVVRLVTPGTLTEDSLLDARAHNFLCAYGEVRGEGALAWVDVSTGAFWVSPITRLRLGPLLARIAPREVLLGHGLCEDLRPTVEEMGSVVTPLSDASFDSAGAQARLNAAFSTASLDGFGQFSKAELGAMGAVLEYLELTQRGQIPHLSPPRQEHPGAVVRLDAATRRNLEITRALSGGRAGSLLDAVDRTLTGPGGRLLEQRLTAPTTDLAQITARLDAIEWCLSEAGASVHLREVLRGVPDMERALQRLSLDRGGPRDLAALRQALAQAADLSGRLPKDAPSAIAQAQDSLRGHEALRDLLDSALVAEPPILARDGGFIAQGYAPELDEARTLRDEGRSVIAQMQARYQDKAGVGALKIKHNNVLGYFIETPATHKDHMLGEAMAEMFIHRQTTANQLRFTTLELSELETKILNAASHALELEKALFATLRTAVLERIGPLAQAARALAELDVAAAWADLALDREWCRPDLDNSRQFKITKGRHPGVEAALAREGTAFVPNSCDLSADDEGATPLWLMTGPNMAGKSTFLRQNALIALLAQAGAFVPAEAAHIGVVDQIFSRVGAADDLARGRSTFMVEMVETAAILNQAGPGALVILDEIGRGTATYDGLSIAWATLEHLHDQNRCRTLFATHYHELTALTERLGGLATASVAVKECENEVIFLHEVRAGTADRSYGVQVAKLAGLPEVVTARAAEVLKTLETGAERPTSQTLLDDLPLFTATPTAPPPPPKSDVVQDRLAEVLPDTLTPREALDLVYELKALLDEG